MTALAPELTATQLVAKWEQPLPSSPSRRSSGWRSVGARVVPVAALSAPR